MKLELIQQPDVEIVSLQEAKEYLGISHDFEDDMLKFLIKSTREAIESVMQKSVIHQTWQYTLSRNEFANLNSDGRPCIFGSVIKIPMPRPPLLDVIGVKIDDKIIDRRRIKVEKVLNTFYVYILNVKNFDASENVTITYTAGLASLPTAVPYQIKLANLMLIANAYQNRYHSTSSIPQGIRELLNPFLNLRIF
jgi:hypothetical protein